VTHAGSVRGCCGRGWLGKRPAQQRHRWVVWYIKCERQDATGDMHGKQRFYLSEVLFGDWACGHSRGGVGRVCAFCQLRGLPAVMRGLSKPVDSRPAGHSSQGAFCMCSCVCCPVRRRGGGDALFQTSGRAHCRQGRCRCGQGGAAPLWRQLHTVTVMGWGCAHVEGGTRGGVWLVTSEFDHHTKVQLDRHPCGRQGGRKAMEA
jgi:hypothetical protein